MENKNTKKNRKKKTKMKNRKKNNRFKANYHLIINDPTFKPDSSSRSNYYDYLVGFIRNTGENYLIIKLFEDEDRKSGKYNCKYCDEFISYREINYYNNDDNVCFDCSINYCCARCQVYTQTPNQIFECDKESEYFEEFNNENLCNDCHRLLGDSFEYVLK